MDVAPVSFIKGSDSLIEGLAIPFSGPLPGGKDIHREKFTKSTDFALDWFPEGRPLLYEHGLDGAIKMVPAGRQTDHEFDPDEGIWARGQLDTSAKYHRAMKRLLEAGALYFSSGTMDHLARKKSATGEITKWPWVELTLTPAPANMTAVARSVKSVELIDHLDAAGIDIPSGLVASALKALDDLEAEIYDEDDEGLRAGLKFADNADRLLADVEAFRTRTGDLTALRAKSGRVLSGATRERLARHPGSLRELADDLDQLLSEADAEKAAKSSSIQSVMIEAERERSRALGVTI